MIDRHESEARNGPHFRALNEWTMQQNLVRPDQPWIHDAYLCECGDRRCTEPVLLSRVEYESIRAEPIRFVVAVHHENPEVDRVIAENDRFAVIEKYYGLASRMARDSDPRRAH